MLYKVIIVLRMSDSSLSDLPTELEGYISHDSHIEPSLPTLPPPIHI